MVKYLTSKRPQNREQTSFTVKTFLLLLCLKWQDIFKHARNIGRQSGVGSSYLGDNIRELYSCCELENEDRFDFVMFFYPGATELHYVICEK